MRVSVRQLLERDAFSICGEASDAAAAVAAAFRESPDLCLISVPIRGDGMWATGQIATALPQTSVVILTASESRVDLLDAIRAGAVGYLLTGMNDERLTSALRGVLAGEAAIFYSHWFTNVSFLWYNVLGCGVVVATALVISFFEDRARTLRRAE
jgi:DNA-binding NarL/FixJ family response regulator